jgi:hypothetical protein
MSTPGHSTSGAEGVGDAGCVTPGFADENRFANRLPRADVVSEAELMMEEAPEQPASANAPTSTAAARLPRFRSPLCPGHIEIAQLSPPAARFAKSLYQANHGDPKADGGLV